MWSQYYIIKEMEYILAVYGIVLQQLSNPSVSVGAMRGCRRRPLLQNMEN